MRVVGGLGGANRGAWRRARGVTRQAAVLRRTARQGLSPSQSLWRCTRCWPPACLACSTWQFASAGTPPHLLPYVDNVTTTPPLLPPSHGAPPSGVLITNRQYLFHLIFTSLRIIWFILLLWLVQLMVRGGRGGAGLQGRKEGGMRRGRDAQGQWVSRGGRYLKAAWEPCWLLQHGVA